MRLGHSLRTRKAFEKSLGCLPRCFPKKCERSEEHTSELQSQSNLVCRLLLEKKTIKIEVNHSSQSLLLMPPGDSTTSWLLRSRLVRTTFPSASPPAVYRPNLSIYHHGTPAF